MRRTTCTSLFFILLADMIIKVTCGNTVDQLLEQLRNASFLDFREIEIYMQEFEQKYLLNKNSPHALVHRESFWLYTRKNPSSRQILQVDSPDSILDSHFSSDKKTVVLVHGWMNAGNSTFLQLIKNLYLQQHDYNIICVDWSDMASNLIYPMARFSIKYIGSQIANLLRTIVRTTGYDWGQYHLVGHSLGAHVCGIAGENVKNDKIGRITGLDPALPLFGSNPEGRLDPGDAAFVDVIHTCSGYLGYSQPCGHADFFPNGGRFRQPGCGFDLGTCSHTRSYEYFAESLVTKTGFYARPCGSWEDYQIGRCNGTADCNDTSIEAGSGNGTMQGLVLMGEHVNKSARGNLFLMTASSKPYALGRYCPPKLEAPPTSRRYHTQWLTQCRNLLNALIAIKVKTFGLSWGLLTNNVYSWFL